jgi:transglutaminase-like putative cysteine protease
MRDGLRQFFALGAPPPQAGMPTFSTIVWLVAGMAGATLPFIGRVPWWLLLFVCGVAWWRLDQSWRNQPPASRGLRHLMSLGVLGALYATGNVGFGLDAAAPLFVGLLWIKLLELDAERDVLVAAFLALFLVTGMLLVGQTLVLTLQAVLAAVVILSGVLWYHTPHLGGSTMVDGSVARPTAVLRLAPLRHAVFRVMRQAVRLVLQALPFAVLLFLFIPRPTLQLAVPSRNAQSGVSDHLDPGRFAGNSLNQAVAFRVEFPNHDMPYIDDLYWRGAVLWQTDGNAWERGPEAPPPPNGYITKAQPDTNASGTTSDVEAKNVVQDITLPANPNPWLYTLETPTAPVNDAMIVPGLVLEWRNGAAGTTTYRTVSNPALRPADWGLMAPRFGRQLPRTVDLRIYQLAMRLSAGGPANDEVVDRAIAWFVDQKFLYSLTPGEMGPNATATFLFERKKGFCGHYASAFCVLMRAAGIPARVVVGYRGGEINQHGGFLVVRQSNAHAWAEVWTGAEETGWRRVDLTSVIPAQDPVTGRPTAEPAARAIGATAQAAQRAQRPWLEQAMFQARLWYEFVESRWDRWAMGYNSDLQNQLLAWLGLDEFGSLAHSAGLIVGGMIVLTGLGTVFWLIPKLRRAWRRPPAERLYDRFCEHCARAGFGRLPQEGPRDHARRVAAAFPPQAAAIDAGIAAWLRLHYGGPAEAGDLTALRQAVAAVARLPGRNLG